MSSNIKYSSVPEALFNKIRLISSHLKIGDKNALRITNPSNARFFNFNFGVDNIENGDVNINLTDDEFKIYYGHDLCANLGANEDKWYDFLYSMRRFAKQNMLRFTIKDVSKSTFDKRDYKFIASQDPENVDVNESKMYGSKKSSYQCIGDKAKIIVRHKKPVDEDIRGSRSRNISKIFIESNGERYELPFKALIGARAMARHINEGGDIDDEIADYICETLNEITQLKTFMTYSKRNHLVTEETEDIITSVSETYKELRKNITGMCSRSGYQRFTDSFEPLDFVIEDDYDLTSLRDKFTVKVTDAHAMEALPLVNRLHASRLAAEQDSISLERGKHGGVEGDIFESWANKIISGSK